ncbi:hypothetical protein TESG_08349 [Trichophyton tonsurans CBS 112818]|uniref:Uncharacterized protein n=1 Tax=Trichophyton tonsurans (strain CBS 112818) TaxID=647933 RepID=F2RU07_TRIT1|nr:hypothetical protein TESG_08349 [Trichophyton tonsurans CBS 112818]
MVPLLAAATLPEGYDQICSIGGRPSHCRDPWDDSIRNPIWLPGPPFDASALPSSSLLWIGAPEPDPHRCCLLLVRRPANEKNERYGDGVGKGPVEEQGNSDGGH